MTPPASRKILLIGKNGQVGWELQSVLASLGEVVAVGSTECDLSKPDQLREMVRRVRPHLIVNAAAYTAVDKAETEPDLVMAVNATAPAILAEEAKRLGAALVIYSSSYVFDGTKKGPYTEEDPFHPVNVYGKYKAEGDAAVMASGIPYFIFRTTHVYALRGKNFLLTIQRLARERDELKIVDDHIGVPTWCRTLAQITGNILTQMLDKHPAEDLSAIQKAAGVYNLSSSGQTFLFDYARSIIELSQIPNPPRLIPIPASEYPTPAKRPTNTALSLEKLKSTFGITPPDWRDDLKTCLDSREEK